MAGRPGNPLPGLPLAAGERLWKQDGARGGKIVVVDDARQRRIAENEAKSRDVNEVIEEQSPGERRSPAVFLCECGRAKCDHVLEITPRDYERVRSHPRWFIVYPGHELPDAESIIEAERGYLVVEKEAEAGGVAEEQDPRG